MRRRKTRATKRIYLIRVIRELWDRIDVGASLRINKVRAYCLEHFDLDFSFEQVRDAFWAFYCEVNRQNGGSNIYAAQPDSAGNRLVGLVKIGSDATCRAIRENHHRRTLEKDSQRLSAHKAYMDADIRKHILLRRVADKIIEAAGLSPYIKSLPPHQ